MIPAHHDGRLPAGGRPSAVPGGALAAGPAGPPLPAAPAPPGTVPTPRRAPAPATARPTVYADGTALCRYLPGAPEHTAWVGWAGPREAGVAVSVVALVELRVTGAILGHDARIAALDTELRLRAVRLSDRAVAHAALLLGRLAPFAALHVGVARAEPGVRALATYDAATARVADEVGLAVVTPGRPARWWEP